MNRAKALPLAAVSLLALAAGIIALQWPTQAGAQDGELVARAGDGEPGYSVNLFLPADITVNTGDTVRWEFPWLEPHSLTFGNTGNPVAPSNPGVDPVPFDGTSFYSSGLLLGGATAALTFEAAGEYDFFCVLHPFMISTVTVVDEGDADTQDDLDAAADAAYGSAITALKALAADLGDNDVAVEKKPDGSFRYTVIVSGALPEGDAMQFFPPTLNIDEGDSILFRNETPVPHTATFGPLPDGVDPSNIEDPLIAEPQSTGDVYEGTGYWNTGLIGVDWPAGLEQEMEFGAAGTYEYYCTLHELQGMTGTVVVAAADDDDKTPTATATPKAPTTGTGSADTGDGDSMTWALGGLALLVVALGGGAAIRARR